MQPAFLAEEAIRREDGFSSAIPIDPQKSPTIAITLGITRIIEQESLEVGLYLSHDGETWDKKPVLSFPQKFYCGTYTLILDLSAHPDARFLRAGWKMNRWGRGEPTPLFSFYIFAVPLTVPELAATATG